MIQLNANKKKKEVYGPTRENSEKISDNVMQSALRRFQSTPEIAARKKTFEADRAKFLADNTLKGMTTPTFPSRARLVENPEEVIKNGIKNKVPVNELMPVWNQYWGEVQENVKNDPSLAPYMYNQTYRDWQTYTGQDSDISEQIKSAIARGADPFEVEQLLSKRTYKATENPYLSDYAYDDVYEMAREYIEENQKEYKDNYKDEIAEKMANRNKPFSYSVTDDPLYQQYLKQARAQGRMAMEDTLSEAAIGAGGMNSYAVAAAQGMNNNYMQKVNDVIPELYQLAYNKHLNEQNRQAEDISLMMALENQDYNRWATERTRNDELENLIYGRTLNDENTKYQRDVYENQLDYERDVYADERDYAREIAERECNYAMENDNFEKAMACAKEFYEKHGDDVSLEQMGLSCFYIHNSINDTYGICCWKTFHFPIFCTVIHLLHTVRRQNI